MANNNTICTLRRRVSIVMRGRGHGGYIIITPQRVYGSVCILANDSVERTPPRRFMSF